jgi:hypothetical protein
MNGGENTNLVQQKKPGQLLAGELAYELHHPT